MYNLTNNSIQHSKKYKGVPTKVIDCHKNNSVLKQSTNIQKHYFCGSPLPLNTGRTGGRNISRVHMMTKRMFLREMAK